MRAYVSGGDIHWDDSELKLDVASRSGLSTYLNHLHHQGTESAYHHDPFAPHVHHLGYLHDHLRELKTDSIPHPKEPFVENQT